MDVRIAEMDGYRAQAKEAVNLGNSILSKAQDTLKILQDFDSTIEQNKADFDAIMLETGAVDTTVANAKAKTAEASNSIEEVRGDDITAFDIANESKTSAEEASTEAQRIVSESSAVKQLASELKASAEDMARKLADTKALVDLKEGAAAENAKLANEALREANKAQTSSGEASEKVAQAKKELDDITILLQNIEDPDPAVLDELERRLDAAERTYGQANLEERLKQLEEAKQRQIVRKTELRKEYELVRSEVDTIAGIIDKMSNGCPIMEQALEN